MKWFRKAAQQGNSGAMYDLGSAYYNGDGVTIDDSLSYAWFRLAKEAGDELAAEAVQRAESTLKERTIVVGFTKIAEMYEKGGSLLGATVVNGRAGETITEFIVAMKQGLKVSDLAGAIHAYPTYSTPVQQLAAEMATQHTLAGVSGKIIRGISKIIR